MTKSAHLLKTLGERWLTPLGALQQCGVLSLAQRVSEWRAGGYVIADKWVRTSTGARIKAYRLIKRP